MIRLMCVDISLCEEWMYQSLYEQASPERKCRADRCRRQEDRLRCVAADALLRLVLGTESYQTEKTEFGKPYIKNRRDFFYNLSHSGQYVVIAWGTSELGVDVQKHETTVRSQAMAQRYFTEEEQAYVGGDAGRFYEIWTKKESYIKYTGEGLKRNLRSFSVLEPEPPVRYCYHTLEGGYSLSLCAAADACAPELLDVRKLFEI